ncbi:aldolase/citrate lyase family protein [Phreatobacter sp.]|uniref:HpcH/HpaI aldolase family protein n=1 Tax=Phreatobacter sp. TaxID=1966341 RepID=UPI0022CC310F|nr:aldolase/citrate lyase family protein [Phreatobacter sp.]MCZ8316112.1 aldolase/citrate lyase family protein [Phreatobacter sp.]
MIRNRIKRRARAGEKLLGAWVFTGSPAACEIYALAGYDIVLIDSEHTPIDVKDVLECVRAVEAGGGDAMVRVPGHDSSHFKRLLDAGIHSFMVPMVDTVDQAHAIVRSCLYPPRGRRGFAATAARSGLYGFHEDYAAVAHEETFLALQVESVEAARDAHAIASIDGVDCLFIGPNDLAGSMNKLGQLTDPALLSVIDDTVAAVTKAGKVSGIIPLPTRDASDCAARGFGIVIGECDVPTLKAGAMADLARHRKAFPGRR